MNANRRKRLRQIIDQGKQLLDQLRQIQEEEQNALEDLPDWRK